MTRSALTKSRRLKLAGGAFLTLSAAGACLALFGVGGCGGHDAAGKKNTTDATANQAEPVMSLELTARVVKLTGLKTAVASKPTKPRALELRGSLALDVNRLVHVHARFPGQIIHLEAVEEDPDPRIPTAPKGKRTLNFMDRVKKGQKLAQIWSKDLGEKKSELVDAMVHLRIDQLNRTGPCWSHLMFTSNMLSIR